MHFRNHVDGASLSTGVYGLVAEVGWGVHLWLNLGTCLLLFDLRAAEVQ